MDKLLEFVKEQLNIDNVDYDKELQNHLEAQIDILKASGVDQINEGEEYYALYRQVVYISLLKIYSLDLDTEKLNTLFLTNLGVLKNAQLCNN